MASRRLLVAALLINVLSCEWIAQASGMSAKEFFDQADKNLLAVVAKAQENNLNRCALLGTCSGNCSRRDCSLDVTDIPNYICEAVYENSYCNGECKWRTNNFKRSYIGAAPTTDLSSIETITEICAQRELDDVFPSVTDPTNNYTPLYFASVDGTARNFPGSDESVCNYFDSRVRPWYNAALYIPKVVVVAIDIGYTMGQPITSGDDKSQTLLATAQNLTKELVNTLSAGPSAADYINIVVFNASDAILLEPNPVGFKYNSSDPDAYPPNHPEFDDLISNLDNIAVGAANAGPSNLSFAMDAAISNMSTFGTEFVKIVIVLTDGALPDSTSPMWESLKAARVKMFVYTFQDDPSGNDQQQVCTIGGSYETFPITRRLNPLFALQSYYSFLANLRTAMNNSVVYGYVYDDYDQGDSQVFTISQVVYDSNSVLLGVVGIDVHKTAVQMGLNIDNDDFDAETSSRRTVYTFDASKNLVLDSTTCGNQTTAGSSCGSDVNIPADGGLCAANDQGKSIAEFSCCKDCVAKVKSKKALIIGLSVGAVSFLGLVAVAYCFGKWSVESYRARKNRKKDRAQIKAALAALSGKGSSGLIPPSP